MRLGPPLLRGTIGPLFVGHVTQKLSGWFDGSGLEGASGSYLATSPPVNEEPPGEPTGRFSREREPVHA